MSIEIKIEALTEAVNNLTKAIVSRGTSVPASVPASAPASAPTMPAPPVFDQPAVTPRPAPAQQMVTAPFSDTKQLVDYVMSTYKQLGAQKGAGIQTVLQQLGYVNINDVQPVHFDAFYHAIEQLKL